MLSKHPERIFLPKRFFFKKLKDNFWFKAFLQYTKQEFHKRLINSKNLKIWDPPS
jgi:hypothetical protein